MSKVTDTKIEKLLAKISEKKISLGERPQAQRRTHCKVKSSNINSISENEKLVELFEQIHTRYKSWKDIQILLGTEVEFIYEGYSYEDWLHDFQKCVQKNNWNKKHRDLLKIEAELEQLVSEESKVTKKLAEFEDLLS